MLITQKGINWNDFPVTQKRGSCCIKEEYYVYVDEHGFPNEIDSDEVGVFKDILSVRTRWIIDTEIPIFKGEGREYIEKLISFNGE